MVAEKNWEDCRCLCLLIEDVYPILRDLVLDNRIFLTPEEQIEIKERLGKLKWSIGGKNE